MYTSKIIVKIAKLKNTGKYENIKFEVEQEVVLTEKDDLAAAYESAWTEAGNQILARMQDVDDAIAKEQSDSLPF